MVNGMSMTTMVDIGVTHNIMKEVRKLDPTLEKGELCMLVVNSKTKLIHRVAQNIAMKINNWSKNANILVASMNYFKIIIGMKLLWRRWF